MKDSRIHGKRYSDLVGNKIEFVEGRTPTNDEIELCENLDNGNWVLMMVIPHAFHMQFLVDFMYHWAMKYDDSMMVHENPYAIMFITKNQISNEAKKQFIETYEKIWSQHKK